ncbi:uncharacterized protein [Salminus brasiliensis]|uniref:uncharacterized protein n=1 Tax=Salminus brasiliensis TaxID=930266 RepID=UPI003B832DA9
MDYLKRYKQKVKLKTFEVDSSVLHISGGRHGQGFPLRSGEGFMAENGEALARPDSDRRGIVLEQNVIGVLGEEVYLRCIYTGKGMIFFASWNRVNSTSKSIKMAGYNSFSPNKTFSKESFSTPASGTNLTVKVGIVRLDMEGQYTCGFNTDEDEVKESLFLTVIARPKVTTHVEEDIVNGTHYQTVSCSAINAKPVAHISWEIRGVPPNPDIFSIHSSTLMHPNGTGSVFSELRFPILLNNESRVSCVVQHPALTQPGVTDIMVQTFVSPTVTMEMELKQKEGKDFHLVLCTATGGRPQPDISWILPTSARAQPSLKPDMGSESVASSQWFPSDLHEGENVTCIFGYPLLPVLHTRTVTLPTYYIGSLQLKKRKAIDLLRLEEGDIDVFISMEVTGNVPSYEINCTKEGGPMPNEVNVTGSDILIKGPVGFNLSGQYQCQASYYRHTAFLQLGIEVNPRVPLPASFPPNISVNLRKEDANVYVECLASDASPAANVTWVLPQDLNGGIQSNISSSNGSHTVQSILALPACLPREMTVECVVEHLDLADPERRQIVLPTCVPVNVTLQNSTVWENGIAYTQVNCSADSMPPSSTIAWHTENCRSGINASETSDVARQSGTLQDNDVGVWSTARLSVRAYAGCTVICVLEHHEREQKSIHFPSLGPPSVHMKVGPLRDSEFWAAVCEYRGDGLVPSIYWVISDRNTTTTPVSVQPAFEGVTVLVSSTYEFELSRHEGKNVTCLIRTAYGIEERRTVKVPRYFISSIVVLNQTSPLRGNHGQHTAVNRIALQEALPHQKIVFRVSGNTPTFNIRCFRVDGSAAHTVSLALVFAEPVSEQDAGLYTCHASWYHHKATVFVQVDVTSKESQTMTFILICFTSATAITLFLFITLCMLCKRSGESPSPNKGRKQRESLAGLMQTPCSPELGKATLPVGKGPEYAELVRYSIVIDEKSTV